jgi:hypothetical protein
MFGLIVFGLLGIYLLLLAWATRRGREAICGSR